MTPESFLSLTARNRHPAFLLSEAGTVVAVNPSGSTVLGCATGCGGDGLDLADFVDDPPETFRACLRTWASTGLPANRPILLRGATGGRTRYRGEGLRVMSPGREANPLVLLHCVPLESGGRAGDPVRADTSSNAPSSGGRPTPATAHGPRTVGKMEAMGNLSAGIAHDFNNLLTVMKVEVELALEHEGLPALVVDSLLSSHAAVVRAESLVAGLLAFSRHELLQISEVDLQAVVDGALPKVIALIGSTPPVVRRAAVPLPVLVDPEHVQTALLALVQNAVEASGEGAPIWIRARREVLGPEFVRRNPGATEGAFAALEVVDHGRGIEPEVQARMFEPFFTTKGRGYGRGLGLAHAFGIVKSLGGYLKARSMVGVGTSFTVYLPLFDPTSGQSP